MPESARVHLKLSDEGWTYWQLNRVLCGARTLADHVTAALKRKRDDTGLTIHLARSGLT